MINNGQSTLLLYCCEDVKSHRSGGDTVPLKVKTQKNMSVIVKAASDIAKVVFHDTTRNAKLARKVYAYNSIYRVYKKKLNKPEIALRLCKAPQCTKFFIEIGCLGTDNVV